MNCSQEDTQPTPSAVGMRLFGLPPRRFDAIRDAQRLQGVADRARRDTDRCAAAQPLANNCHPLPIPGLGALIDHDSFATSPCPHLRDIAKHGRFYRGLPGLVRQCIEVVSARLDNNRCRSSSALGLRRIVLHDRALWPVHQAEEDVLCNYLVAILRLAVTTYADTAERSGALLRFATRLLRCRESRCDATSVAVAATTMQRLRFSHHEDRTTS
jgi:hypothetical protein